jgi:Protein of unknown function (DUF3301)
MTLPEIALLVAFACAGWFLWDSLRVREIANDEMRSACEREGWLFLDDTVAMQSLWIVRNGEGRVCLRRVYGFEYSDTGHNRRKGSITMIGSEVSSLSIDSHTLHDGQTLH